MNTLLNFTLKYDVLRSLEMATADIPIATSRSHVSKQWEDYEKAIA